MPDRPRQTLASAVKAIADAVEAEEGRLTAKKRRIIESALVCFADQGFDATSTAEIAERAGVAEATIFRHFNTKKELLVRLVKPIAGHVLIPAALEELAEIQAKADGDFRNLATAVMRSRLAFADRYAPLIRIVVQELPLRPELRQLLFSESLAEGLATLVEAMESLKGRGQIRSDIPPTRMIRWFGSLMAGYYLVRSLTPDQAFDDEEEIAATVDFMIRGAGPRLRA
jgi:AcrR family transcriptional regulator